MEKSKLLKDSRNYKDWMVVKEQHTVKFPDWYVKFRFKNKDQFAALHQLERVSAYRLCRKMGELDDADIKKVVEGFIKLYVKNTPSG